MTHSHQVLTPVQTGVQGKYHTASDPDSVLRRNQANYSVRLVCVSVTAC